MRSDTLAKILIIHKGHLERRRQETVRETLSSENYYFLSILNVIAKNSSSSLHGYHSISSSTYSYFLIEYSYNSFFSSSLLFLFSSSKTSFSLFLFSLLNIFSYSTFAVFQLIRFLLLLSFLPFLLHLFSLFHRLLLPFIIIIIRLSRLISQLLFSSSSFFMKPLFYSPYSCSFSSLSLIFALTFLHPISFLIPLLLLHKGTTNDCSDKERKF